MKARIIQLVITSFSMFIFISINSYGQTHEFVNPPPDSTERPNNAVSILENVGNDRTFELKLSYLVIAFGILVLAVEAFLAFKGKIKPEYTYKCVIITLVIVGSLFLIAAGYSSDQINGITGLLGSIAGYLLAKNDPTSKEKPNTNADESK